MLTVISDKKLGISSGGSLIDYYNPEIKSAQDYYPFGMTMPGRFPLGGAPYYKYTFNGKENDWEAKGWQNQQDYGMRAYDGRLGRFLSVDPLQKDYPWYTPYQFAGNKPIWAVDLDGGEEKLYTVTDLEGRTFARLISIKTHNDHEFLGFKFKTEIDERYVVWHNENVYYIGHGSDKGHGNRLQVGLFKSWLKNPQGWLLPLLFYNQEQAKSGRENEVIEAMRQYTITGVENWLTTQLGIGILQNNGRIDVKKPKLVPGRHDKLDFEGKKNPLYQKRPGDSEVAPANSKELFKKSIPDENGKNWWAKDADGTYHRFAGTENEVHWNGSTGTGKGIPLEKVPDYVKQRLNGTPSSTNKVDNNGKSQ